MLHMAKKKRKLRRVQQIRAAGSALSKIFLQGELQILSLFASTIRISAKAPNRITGSKARRAVHRTTDRILGEVGKAAQKEAAERLTEAYESTADRIARFAEQLETDVAALRREDVPNVGGNVGELTRALDASWNVELRHMRRDADDIYRAIVEAAMNDRESNGESVRSAMQKALNQFAEQGITGFTDKAGRRWGLEEYTDMAMRTAMQRASMQATIDSMVNYGWDLCFVNAHMGACPLCQKWQGVIMSLTGKTPDYPTLQEAMDEGLFHPNCAHILQIYFPGISVLGQGVPEGYTNAQSTELYEARQRQRTIERNIRKWKRLQAAAASPEDERYAQAMVRKWQLAAQENAKGDVRRRYDREGGRVLLSDAAKKIKPFTVKGKDVTLNASGAKSAIRNTGKQVYFNPQASYTVKLDGYSDTVNAGISKAIRDVAMKGSDSRTEHMYLVNLNTGGLDFYETNDEFSSVGYAFREYIANHSDEQFAFVHNHNTDGSFSESDMHTLLTGKRTPVMIATRNDGIIYVAERAGPPLPTGILDDLYPEEMEALNMRLRNGIITMNQRTIERENLLVNNTLRDYTKGGRLIEYGE